MNVFFATSEATPFAKTGGLADVSGALPGEIARLGHQVTLILPAYRHALRSGQPITDPNLPFVVPVGSRAAAGRFLKSRLPGTDVEVLLVQHDGYFDRPELYREKGQDYRDNCERFVFFSRAVLEAVRLAGRPVDLIHCNDWQTGLIPAYLKTEYRHAPGFESLASLLTIHNIAYQGLFWHWDMLLTGLDWRYFNWRQLEFYGQLNLLKAGLVFADSINTVSPRYAVEIQQGPLGCGLENTLRHRAEVVSGILNGASYAEWNPATDPALPRQYDVHSWREGKAVCKAALQKELGLAESSRTPLVGLVGRLADQKGWKLVADVMRRWAPIADVQWAVLGTGEPPYHALLGRLAAEHPEKVAARLTFSDEIAHRIEAAADLFVMASEYEPCGLNQLYSLKYGTVPVVRATGGLADTITDATPDHLAAGKANGFSFEPFHVDALEGALVRACDLYRQQPEAWARLVESGMRQDWSWGRSAPEYVRLYQKTIERRKAEAAP